MWRIGVDGKKAFGAMALLLGAMMIAGAAFYEEECRKETVSSGVDGFDGLYDIGDLMWDIDPTLYSISAFELLIETKEDGSVSHHFVKKADIETVRNENYTAEIGVYKSLTDESYQIPCATYDYGEMLGLYDTIAKNEEYMPDYKMKYQTVSLDSVIWPDVYCLQGRYKRSEIKRLEQKLNERFLEFRERHFAEKYGDKAYNTENLYALSVNGEVIITDLAELIETKEMPRANASEKLRNIFYMYDILNPALALRFNDGKTVFEESLPHPWFLDEMFDEKLLNFEEITGMSKELTCSLNRGIMHEINLSDYLTEEQNRESMILGREMLELVERIHNDYRGLICK